ncbi:MAG TPA: bacteriohopanetetrol glucosamine biosynthesis glycosyltransferase HpnI [Terriglobales bacterium]|nr:bacteriohopanetetrol glucosamine biosynthesis glycosyltransferase HpnI [Terriglobales bacterium]
MAHFLSEVLEIVTGAGTLAGIGYYVACLWSATTFTQDCRAAARSQLSGPHASPPVSILKLLMGEDPEIYESFRSHCLQDYPQYEIVFGVSDANDPAVDAVERLRREFPQHSIQLVVCSQSLGTNTKVSNLAQMVRAAHHNHFVVSDSDIRVDSGYLRRVISPLAEVKVGLVTCLYRGNAGNTFSSRLESLGISTDFCVGVLVARLIEGPIRFALGSTMAFRRRDLEAIGGFESFVDFLADDYELGKRISALGKEVRLSDVVVETFLPAYTLRQFFAHQLRWARGVRDARRAGYLGLLFTFGWQWSALAILVTRGAAWALELSAVALFLRLMVAWIVGWGVLKDRQVLRFLPLIPVRDGVAVLIWLASFASNTVTWRGDRFQLKNGKLTRIPAE